MKTNALQDGLLDDVANNFKRMSLDCPSDFDEEMEDFVSDITSTSVKGRKEVETKKHNKRKYPRKCPSP